MNPDPNRHEASRPAFEAAHNAFSHERDPNGEYKDLFEWCRWNAWCRALDWQAAQVCVWVPYEDQNGLVYGVKCDASEIPYEEEPNFDRYPFCPACGRRVKIQDSETTTTPNQ